MKVLIVGPAHPYRGGIADTNEALGRAFQRIGADTSLITFKVQYPNFLFPGKTQFTEDPAPQGQKILRYIHAFNPFNWISTAIKIRKMKADLIVVRYWLPLMGPCLGSINWLSGQKKKIIGLCDNILPHEKRAGDRLFTKFFLASCSKFMVMSRTVESELLEFTSKAHRYLPHPINDNLGEQQDKVISRQKLGLKKDGKYLLFFGLVRKYKGLDLMLKAMADKRIKDLNVELLVVGEFYDDPEEYHSLCKDGGIVERVHFEDRFIATSEIKDYFSACDMVTQTYHSASQSGITQIAYNFNSPMLVTNVGGLAEIVPHSRIGYVLEKDATTIADAIVDFYENERYDAFSKEVAIEKKKYSWDRFAEELIQLNQE
jgi:glycosyltransferase involved in cell wall biosynthesis